MNMTNLEKLQSAIDTLGHAANTVYGFSITGSVAIDNSIYRFSSEDVVATITIHKDDTVDAKVLHMRMMNRLLYLRCRIRRIFIWSNSSVC